MARPLLSWFKQGWRQRFIGYLVLTAILLLPAAMFMSPASAERPDLAAAHRLEYIDVPGEGFLTATSRWSLRTTAWLTSVTVERQEALLGPTPVATRLGTPIAAALQAWHDPKNGFLRFTLLLIVMVLAGVAAYTHLNKRVWLTALIAVILSLVVLSRPAMLLGGAGLPGRGMAAIALKVMGDPMPSSLLGPSRAGGGVSGTQHRLGDAFWTAYVTAPTSRANTSTSITTQELPAERAGLLALLQKQVNGLGGGMSGFQKAVIGCWALLSSTVFSASAASLALVAWIAQTLVFLLSLTGLVLLPVGIHRRRWRQLAEYWLVPLLLALALTFIGAFGSWLVTGTAVALADAGEWLLSGLSGSALALVEVWLAGRWLRRRLRALVFLIDQKTESAAPPAEKKERAA